MLEKHESAVNKVLKLAKMINFDINDLKYRKIDVDQQKPTDSGKCASPSKRDDDLVRCTLNVPNNMFNIVLNAREIFAFFPFYFACVDSCVVLYNFLFVAEFR